MSDTLRIIIIWIIISNVSLIFHETRSWKFCNEKNKIETIQANKYENYYVCEFSTTEYDAKCI